MKHNSKPDRNQEIIDLYLLGHNLREIGNFYAITFQRVHEILKNNNIILRPKLPPHYYQNKGQTYVR